VQYKDLLRSLVLLVAAEATALGALTAVAIDGSADPLFAVLAFGWWLLACAIGVALGSAERAASALAGPLAAAKTQTSLPADPPTRTALLRLGPVAAFGIVAGAAGLLWPEVPAIATGFALLIALAWRRREAAVTAIEDRDGVCFYVERSSPLGPVKLIRTPGLKRGRAPSIHPPPPPPSA
jgi:hypothetical protein